MTPRDVVDNSYDVGLCVVLDDSAGHDVYQEHPLHKEFIAQAYATLATGRKEPYDYECRLRECLEEFEDTKGSWDYSHQREKVDELPRFTMQRLERLVAEMDFVPREEFEAVKAMAAKARAENEALEARITALESKTPG